MKPTLANLFPNASQSCQKANPQLSATLTHPNGKTQLRANVVTGCEFYSNAHGMNKTEAEFALRLEAMKRAGEILRWEFEGMTLRWAGMRYTPDFVVFQWNNRPPMFIEVKGGHIWDRDIVRFKGARAHWPEFSFEMHQKTKQGWKRIH